MMALETNPSRRPAFATHGVLRLPGFTPLVEESSDGARLRPLLDQTLLLPESLESLHTLVVGKPGSGKTTRVIERIIDAALRDGERTLVVIDPGKALEAAVHGLARVHRPGGRVFHFDWLDPGHCVRWNLLSQVRDRSSAAQFSKLLGSMTPIGREESRYFHQRAERLLTHLLLALRTRDGEASLRTLRAVIEQGETALAPLAASVNSGVLADFAKQIREHNNQNTLTSFTELESWFAFLEDDRIVETTAGSTFNPEILEQEPCVVYVGLAEESVEQVKPVLNLFLRSVLDALVHLGTRNGGPLRRPVSVVVDECPRLGRILGLEALANTLRKRRVGLTFALQTTDQLHQVYGDAAGSFAAAFSNHVFVPPVSETDGERACAMSGLMEVSLVSTEADGVTPTQLQPQTRPVLTVHEVTFPPLHPVFGPLITFKLNNVPMFQAYLRASWEIPSIQEAKDAWRPDHIPCARPELEARLPEVKLSSEDAASLVPGLMEHLGQLLARTSARWPSSAQLALYRELRLQLPQLILGAVTTLPVKEQRRLLEHFKRRWLEWKAADQSAREWWRHLESDLPQAIRLAFELAAREVSLSGFLRATTEAGTESCEARLHYFDFRQRVVQSRRPVEVSEIELPPQALKELIDFEESFDPFLDLVPPKRRKKDPPFDIPPS